MTLARERIAMMILTTHQLKRLWKLAFVCALASCASLLPAHLAAARRAQQTQTTPTSPSQPAKPAVKLNVLVLDEQKHAGADARREEISVFEDNVPQAITYFEKETLPVSYALVVDNSGSMQPLLDRLIKTGVSLVIANKPEDETAIIRFVDSESVKMLQGFTGDKSLLRAALGSMRTEGGQTALVDALYLALETVAGRRRGDPARRWAIVLVTDGDERASYYKSSQLQKLIRESGIQVFVIGLTDNLDGEGGNIRRSPREKAKILLDSIAHESGGRVFYPKKVPDLIDAVDEIARELRTQYVVGYEPTNVARDGKFRKVEVKIADSAGQPKRIALARGGYFAVGGEPKKKEKK
jgi:Ca-activated chloride channel family protein